MLLTILSMRCCSTSIVVVLVSVASAAACGGKIADDADPRGGSGGTFIERSPTVPPETTPSPSPAPKPTPTPSAPTSPSKPTVEDACMTICDRNGQCGALQSDCYARCTEDIHTATACGPEASVYIHCYADNLEDCSPLPPLCEDAYCAFTRCAGRVVPRYCR